MKTEHDPQLSTRGKKASLPYAAADIRALPGMGRDFSSRIRAMRFVLDFAMIALAHYLAWLVRFGLGWFGTSFNPSAAGPYAIASVMSTVILFILLIVGRLHDEDTLFRGSGEFARIAKAAGSTIIVFPALAYLTHTPAISRIWLLMSLVFAIGFLTIQRLIVRRIVQRQREKGRFRRPSILISRMPEVEGADVSAGAEFDVLARFSVEEGIGFLRSLRDGSSSGPPQNGLGVILLTKGIDDDETWKVILHAGHAGSDVFVESPVRPVARDRMTVRPFGTRTVMRVSPPALTGIQAVLKRAFDLTVSGIGFVVLAPVIALVSLAVLVSSGRPIFYGQERVGRDGRVFRIWKFRTMRRDSEDVSGPVWAAKDDPRRTPLGKFLRSTSIDELPQIWNVLKGEMSLVGPRPERPNFVGEFNETIPWYPHRHRMRPGITGWAQAHGLRGNTPLEDRVAFDNYYIEHWSLGLDLKILLLTVREVVRAEHGY